MTIKLLTGINTYHTRVSEKNITNLYSIKFINLQTLEEIVISVTDLSPNTLYFVFNIEVDDKFMIGEYKYEIYSDTKCIRSGIAIYEFEFTNKIKYSGNNKRIVYEG